jgi:hypothetical protein
MLITSHDLTSEERQRLPGDVDAVVARSSLGEPSLLGEIEDVLGQLS